MKKVLPVATVDAAWQLRQSGLSLREIAKGFRVNESQLKEALEKRLASLDAADHERDHPRPVAS